MKRKLKLSVPILVLVLVMMLSIVLTGCSADPSTLSPQQLIEEAYGNKEFKISFSSDTLDKPIKDLTYSANKIPLLPTPQKVGYIFEGWFLDNEFLIPYTDDALYLSMKNITLYPKWSKERFINDGVYDIEFTANIVDGTVKKGDLTDKYGDYGRFPDVIDYEECQIEKDGDELLLKLQFDSKVNTPWQGFDPVGSVYSVRINHKIMGTKITVKNKIDSFGNPIKTFYIRINDWDLSKPLVLDVDWTNFENKDIPESDVYKTTTSYQVAINLTKIIGFSQVFADTSVKLEKGYYLAKSFMRTEENEDSMGIKFNPVYSYIYSDGENYKLIKQNIPYLGLVEQEHPLYNPLNKNFYNRMATFTAMSAVFDVDSLKYQGEGKVTADYYPAKDVYNGGRYRKCVTEYNADTNKLYNIIDIDNDLTKEYMVLTAVSGYMERGEGMGYIKQILSIDYRNLIRLADVDYVPLEGECYEYADRFNYYPGNYRDLDERNLTFDAVKENGMSIEMPNFYYSVDADGNKKVLSSRFEIVPTNECKDMVLSESRNKIAEFNFTAKVYGYNVKNGDKLYVDRMSPQTFALEGGNYNNQLRDTRQIKTGKACIKDETIINKARLFNEKVNNNIKYSNVDSCVVYELNDGVINYSKTLFYKEEFTFNRDIAIEYKYTDDYNNKITTIVELKQIADPEITINYDEGDDNYQWKEQANGHYTKTALTQIGRNTTYPKVKYTWGERKNIELVSNFYESMSGDKSINPSKALIFTDDLGTYRLTLTTALTDSFTITDKNMYLMYELNNEYGERKYIYFDYVSDPKKAYTITDSNGNVVASDDVKYKNVDGELQRESVYVNYSEKPIYDSFNASTFKDYYHSEGTVTNQQYRLAYYIVYGNKIDSLNPKNVTCEADTKQNMANNINSILANKDFGLVTFYYSIGSNTLVVNYLYKVTFNGEEDYVPLNEKTFFTNTDYTFARVNLVSNDRQILSTLSANVTRYIDGRPAKNDYDKATRVLSSEGHQYRVVFKAPGTYKIEMNYSIPQYILGDESSSYRTIITYSEMIEVQSNKGDVEITYVTDSRHPFSNNGVKVTEKTVKYSLADGIKFITGSAFDSSGFDEGRSADVLHAWSTRNGPYGGNTYVPNKDKLTGEEFIETFGSNHIKLYAIWEIKLTIRCEIHDGKDGTNNKYKSTEIARLNDRNSYEVVFPKIFEREIPLDDNGNKMVFIGWKADFLPGIINESRVTFANRDDYVDKPQSFFTAVAMFEKEFEVKFDMRSDAGETVAYPEKTEKVLRGHCIEDPIEKMDVEFYSKAMKDKYTFKGYYVAGDTSKTIVDLSTYKIYEDTKFVARWELKS